jgi:glycosyltransferase involved in cell wall biosynthesis
MPKVTVLMPVHNGADFLAEAIESILTQTFGDFEFVIVDDGSTDATSEILRLYAERDARIRVLREARVGIVTALNRGLAIASGMYLARMDADDCALPNRLKIQVDLLDASPTVIACGSAVYQIGSKSGLVSMPRTDRQCKLFLAIGNCFAHPAVMFRMDAIKLRGLNYSDDYLYAEDYKLWSDMAVYGDFHNLKQPLLRYRVHSAQVGQKKRASQRVAHLRVAHENLRRMNVSICTDDLGAFLWPNREGVLGIIRYQQFCIILLLHVLRQKDFREWFFVRKMLGIVFRNTLRLSAGGRIKVAA